jgi:hypothetical protein
MPMPLSLALDRGATADPGCPTRPELCKDANPVRAKTLLEQLLTAILSPRCHEVIDDGLQGAF